MRAPLRKVNDGIRALGKEVEEATETRNTNMMIPQGVLAANSAAVDTLKFDKNRLNTFCNHSQYKPPPTSELSEADQINLNMGGATFVPTETTGGIARIGIYVLQDGAEPPPPYAAYLGYNKRAKNLQESFAGST